MDSLPSEIIRYFIPFLPLTSLIAARGVNTQWRALAQTAALHPARKTLINTFLAAIHHPNFRIVIDTLKQHIFEFDREAYLADLRSRGCVLPAIFELWVLEWPTKAVHFWAWPGIRMGFAFDHCDYYCYFDCNMLHEDYVVVQDIPVPMEGTSGTRETKMYQALAIWSTEEYAADGIFRLWLVVDPNEQVANDREGGRIAWTHCDSFADDPVHHILNDPPFRSHNFVQFLDMLDVESKFVESALDRLEIAHYDG